MRNAFNSKIGIGAPASAGTNRHPWPVPCVADDIAKWSLRVASWNVTFNYGGNSYGFVITSQAAGDERGQALPCENVDIPEGLSLPNLTGGYGAWSDSIITLPPAADPDTYPGTDFELGIYIGPSMAGRAFPFYAHEGGFIVARDEDGDYLFPIWVTVINQALELEGTNSAIGNVSGTSAMTCTFCGIDVPLYIPEDNGGMDATPGGSIAIAPASYFEFLREDGTEPIYDATTGEQLVTPVPRYPPH